MDDSNNEDLLRHVRSSKYVLAVAGAGLSASSGLPTFQGAGATWHGIPSKSLASPDAFERDPKLVWDFYEERRQRALAAEPNAGHKALAGLAQQNPEFFMITQNIDGLSQKAQHPQHQIAELHGSLLRIRCSNRLCTFVAPNLEASTFNESPVGRGNINNLPVCPMCSKLLRPGVTWFGEMLPRTALSAISQWVKAAPRVEVLLVVGTAGQVTSAAAYVEDARRNGTTVVHFNLVYDELVMRKTDYFVQGDAAVTLPRFIQNAFGVSV